MLRPARTAEADPATTYADQEDGQRGFLLTGDDRALHKYVSGRTHAAGLQTTLQTLTGDDPQAITLLRGVVTAGVMWHQQAAEPQIAVRGKDRCGTPCWLPSSPRASDCSTQFVLASTR
jgi:CHASE3 domain sensor protein